MKHLLIGLIVATSLQCLGNTKIIPGTDSGNGGDTCEIRIQNIVADIESWIHRDGHIKLEMHGMGSPQNYKVEMLHAIGKLGNQISCPSDVLYVDGYEKVCKNTSDQESATISCTWTKFNRLSEENQYKLVHHELAGIAKFEQTVKGVSTYPLTNQVTAYLENKIVKQLAIKGEGIGDTNALSPNGPIRHIPQESSLIFNRSLLIPPFERKVALCRHEQFECSFSTYPESPKTRKISAGHIFTVDNIGVGGRKSRNQYPASYTNHYISLFTAIPDESPQPLENSEKPKAQLRMSAISCGPIDKDEIMKGKGRKEALRFYERFNLGSFLNCLHSADISVDFLEPETF